MFKIIKKWGRDLPRRKEPMPRGVKDVFIHHTVTNEPPKGATLEADAAHTRLVETIGIGQGHGGISYSFGVPKSGRAFEGQGWGRIGAHTYGWNSISYGIVLYGNYMLDKPTDEQIEAVVKIIRQGQRWRPAGRFIAKDVRIRGHRDVGAQGGGTACPGDKLYAMLPEIRRRVRR